MAIFAADRFVWHCVVRGVKWRPVKHLKQMKIIWGKKKVSVNFLVTPD